MQNGIAYRPFWQVPSFQKVSHHSNSQLQSAIEQHGDTHCSLNSWKVYSEIIDILAKTFKQLL